MIRRLLCWLGFHDWKCVETWSGVYSNRETVTQRDKWKCLSCQRVHRVYVHPTKSEVLQEPTDD